MGNDAGVGGILRVQCGRAETWGQRQEGSNHTKTPSVSTVGASAKFQSGSQVVRLPSEKQSSDSGSVAMPPGSIP